MSYDRNDISKTTEDGIDDLVKDIIGGFVSLDQAFAEIKFKPLQKKISKAIEIKDDEDWDAACAENTVDSYSVYLSSYNKEKPWYKGKHVAEAKDILYSLTRSLEEIDDEAWMVASTEDTIESYQSYLSVYDKTASDYTGNHVTDAKSAINAIVVKEQDEKDWQTALTLNTEEGYKSYLSVYDKEGSDYKGIHIVEVQNALDSLVKSRKERELADEEMEECHTLWADAEATNTTQTYQEFINKFYKSSIAAIQNLVLEAKNRIIYLQDDEDWQFALKTNSRKGYDKYIAKYESLKSEYQGKYLDKARSWVSGKPNPKYKFIKIAGGIIILLGIILYFGWWWKPGRRPLTEEEINAILVQYTDSLKQDLFDGFYLAPMSKADISNYQLANDSSSHSESYTVSDNKKYFSKYDVIFDFMLDNGKYVVKNKYGETILLPESENGIDSICVKEAPFFEYVDNNGLRRVVALHNDDLYFYLGGCGKHDNLDQFILVNEKGEYGILDKKGYEEKHFINDKIERIPSIKGYYVLNGGVSTEYVDGNKYVAPTLGATSAESTSSTSASIELRPFYDYSKHAYGFKDVNGTVKITPQYLSADIFINGYARIKGQNGYGIINKSNVKCVPLQYSYLERHGNVAIVKLDNGKYGVISMTGKRVIAFEYSSISNNNNFFKVKNASDKYGLFDMNGNRILNDIYDEIAIYSLGEGLIPCKFNGKWGYVSKSGQKVIDYKFNDYSQFSQFGLAAVKDSTNLYGYINKSGNFIIRPKFHKASSITEYGARVGDSDGKYALIDKDGNLLTQFYKEVGLRLYENRVYVVNDSLIGFSDNQKNLVIPFMFSLPPSGQSKPYFDEYSHLCKVYYNGVEWYINPNGAFAYPVNCSPTDQNISRQIKEAKVEAEAKKAEVQRKKKEIEDRENRQNLKTDRKAKAKK